MGKKEIRLLNADEIEVRVSTISEKGVSHLLYKDARVDQKILDEVFGIFGWKRSHESIDGNLYCTVSIKNEDTGEWVGKQDVGTRNMTEAEKSQASDSFKRACFNIGIGRELYSAPFIWVPAGRLDIYRDGNKLRCRNRFRVSSISYGVDREISGLVIANEDGTPVYSWGSIRKPSEDTEAKEPQQKKKSSGRQKASGVKSAVLKASEDRAQQDGDYGLTAPQMEALSRELGRTGVSMDAVRERYSVGEPGEMSPELYTRVMAALAKTKSLHTDDGTAA